MSLQDSSSVLTNTNIGPGSPLVNAPMSTPPVVTPTTGAGGGSSAPVTSTPTNLYLYYTGLGQNLPSVADRAPLYTKAGGTGAYTGDATQNGFLLNSLLNPPAGGTPPPVVPPAGGTTGSTSSTSTDNGTSPYIGSSDPTRTAENNLTNSINTMGSNPDYSGLTSAHNDALKALTDYQTALADRQAAEEADINKQFDLKDQQTKDAQAKETGSTKTGLLRMGGYLGESGSGTGVLNSLGEKHNLEIATLTAQRESALQAARSAVSDKQFATADALAKEAKSYESEINTRKNDFFNQVLQLTSSNRQTVDDTLTKLSDLPSTSLSQVPQSTLDSIDNFYKSPGFAKAYLSAAAASNTAKSQKSATDAMSSYVDLLQKLPAGKSVKLPDGSTLTGIGKTSDVETFNKEDKNGNVTIVSFNKGTGKVQEYGAGQIGTPSKDGVGTPDTQTQSDVAEAMNALQKDPANNNFISDVKDSSGTVTKSAVSAYNSMYQLAVSKGAGKWFLDNYPPEHWVGGQAASAFKTQ